MAQCGAQNGLGPRAKKRTAFPRHDISKRRGVKGQATDDADRARKEKRAIPFPLKDFGKFVLV